MPYLFTSICLWEKTNKISRTCRTFSAVGFVCSLRYFCFFCRFLLNLLQPLLLLAILLLLLSPLAGVVARAALEHLRSCPTRLYLSHTTMPNAKWHMPHAAVNCNSLCNAQTERIRQIFLLKDNERDTAKSAQRNKSLQSSCKTAEKSRKCLPLFSR